MSRGYEIFDNHEFVFAANVIHKLTFSTKLDKEGLHGKFSFFEIYSPTLSVQAKMEEKCLLNWF